MTVVLLSRKLRSTEMSRPTSRAWTMMRKKLVLILLLLITSLMTVVGAFMMTSITRFYRIARQ